MTFGKNYSEKCKEKEAGTNNRKIVKKKWNKMKNKDVPELYTSWTVAKKEYNKNIKKYDKNKYIWCNNKCAIVKIK